MRGGFRTAGLAAIIVLVALAVQSGLENGRARPGAAVELISPPPDVVLPAGQTVEVRYRVAGAAMRAELWCDDTLLAADAVEAGQELAHAWVPAGRGARCCTVQARDERDAALATARRCVDVGPDGSPVRLAGP